MKGASVNNQKNKIFKNQLKVHPIYKIMNIASNLWEVVKFLK